MLCTPASAENVLQRAGSAITGEDILAADAEIKPSNAGDARVEGMSLTRLANAVNRLDPTLKWQKDAVPISPENLASISSKGPVIVGLTDEGPLGQGPTEYHTVVVESYDRASGHVTIMDPQPLNRASLADMGTRYRMTISDFMLDWDGDYIRR